MTGSGAPPDGPGAGGDPGGPAGGPVAGAGPPDGGDAGGEAPDASGRAGRVARRLAQLALTVLLTWFILERLGISVADLQGVDPVRWRPNWGALAGASGLLLAGYVVSALLWGGMVAALGGPRLPAFVASRIYFTANLGRYVPGKLWQIAGLALLSRREGVSAWIATAAAVLGQGAALAGAAFVGATALFGGGERVRVAGAAAFALIALGLLVSLVPGVVDRGARWVLRRARQEGGDAPVLGVTFALRWVALYGLNWALYGLAFWALVESFHLDGALLDVAPAFAAAYLLGYAAVFAPAGIGVREGFLVLFLQPALGTEAALAMAVVARIWTTVVELVPAIPLAALQATGKEGKGTER